MMSVLAHRGHRKRSSSGAGTSPVKSERTRQAILDAALEFLWTHPFRDLSVAELMSLVGASRSAFYQYFSDLHDLMEVLLDDLRVDILSVAMPWFKGDDNPALLLQETLSEVVAISYKRGPIFRAIVDASAADERLEQAWAKFMKGFDDVVTQRIEQHQAKGLIPEFPARPVAIALNRLDVSMIIEQFGQRPRGNSQAVQESLTRIWISTLYGVDALSQLARSPR